MAAIELTEEALTFWRERRVLITGCSGFLGSWLTQALTCAQANVVGIVRDVVPWLPCFRLGWLDAITRVNGSIEDYPLLERCLNEYQIDTVFHLGAQTLVGIAYRNPLSTFETNIRGTWNLLEACRRSQQIRRVIVASSDKAYGIHAQLPYTEELALQGKHPYDVSKSCADLISIAYHHTYGTPACVTRCGNLFGGGDFNFSRIIPGTIRSVLGGQRPIIRSDGTPTRDYIHVDDAVAGYLLLARQMDDPRIHGKAFNFGSGAPLSVLQVTQKILAAMDCRDLEPEILNDSGAEIAHQYLSSELARQTLGWAPKKTFEQRLGQTISWYRDYFAEVGRS